jgi:hypothetical protein
MGKPTRFTFSLLRMLLSIAVFGAVLAIGRWRDAPPAPIFVAAATAGLMMFVVQWRHWAVLAFEAFCSLWGAAIASSCLFLPVVGHGPGERAETVLSSAVVGAAIGWLVGGWYLRFRFPTEVDRIMRGRAPSGDDIEVRPLAGPERPADETAQSRSTTSRPEQCPLPWCETPDEKPREQRSEKDP